MADYDFKLEIGGIPFPHEATLNNIKIIYNLHNVRFNRKIYQPGEIVAEVSINPSMTIPQLTEMLLLREVKLKKGDTVIAENYYVHEILPQEKNGDVGIFVKLMIYSMDKLMTLDKYSKVYAGMKLGAEILNKERFNFRLGDTAIKVDFEKMRMLKYMYSRIVSDKGQTGKNISIEIPSEFIQPYLVQYNESFYDFLSRTANRCGEFLYFEDGELVLGLKTRTEKTEEEVTGTVGNTTEKETITKEKELDPIVISDYDSVTYKSISTSKLDIERYARDTMKDKWGVMENTNYDIVKKNKAGYPNDAFPGHTAYNSELASDEFFFPLYADKFTTFTREMGATGTDGEKAATQIFPKLCDITANSSDIIDFGFKLAADEAKTLIEAEITNAKKNKDGNTKLFGVGDKEKDAKIDLVLNSAKMMEKGDGNTCLVPFGTLSKDGWTTLDYYRDVHKYEEQLQRDIICIDMGTNYADVKLGDKIKFGDSDIPYTVIQILMDNGKEWTHSYTDYEGNTSPKAQANQNQKIFAIPYLKSGVQDYEVYKPYPPVLDTPVVRKAEPQTAFITASNDPKLQGRVRIVYPWQTDSTGAMKKLADAEAEYEQAQKDYQEKKQKQENLEKELDVLKREKQLLKDNTTDKKEALKQIHEDIKTVNEKLGKDNDQDDALKDDDITDFLVAKEYNKCTTLENEVNELKEKLSNQEAKLRELESEKAQLYSELAYLEAEKEKQEEEKAELEKQKGKETDSLKISELEEEIKKREQTIKDLEEKISGNKDKKISGKKKDIEKKEKDISDLIGDKDTADTIKKIEADLDAKREELDAQKERYQLVQQKKEIQEYYAELNSTKAEDIEKKIAVYDSDNKLTGGKEYDLNQAKKATETAKTTLEDKERDINKIGKEVQAAVAKMASPWIRMTSPMATDGGGTIFKPRLGDEVLVNYDCGNIERPYVVGSLFSKNVLEPDERINRTVGPALHSSASIAIVSPNGHGITFKDPSSDAGFASSVYPGIGLLNKYIINNTDAKWPESKDLAGGIKIGDRYGLYSIDMSSDRRSVKISSSLGTVNLDAFTGITISAPNGDIKIEGKNVSIKAGNNLTLTSGTNIETRSKRNKKFDSGAAFGYTLEEQGVNRLLKEFVTPFIDVSLARSVWEIILMPIEGTTQIKSHRYMKLEAGSGNATIKHDRYKRDYATKLAKTQQLMSLIKPQISVISTKIDAFSNTYLQKRALVDITLNNYKTNANIKTYLKTVDNPKINDIILAAKQAYKTVNGVVQPWTDWNENNPTIFNGKLQDSLDDRGKDTFFGHANSFGKDVFELTKHIKTFATIHSYQGQDDVENALQAAFTDLDTYLQQVWGNESKKSQFLPSSDNLKKLLKRKWAALFLMKLSEAKKDLLKLSYSEKALTDDMLTDNFKWGVFVKNLESKSTNLFFSKIAEAAIKVGNDFANPVKDRLMWGDQDSGQILLSDDSDYTINFHKGQPNAANSNTWKVEEDANQKTLGNVKKSLIDLN